jgi:Glycosyl hydrolases family 2, TIM barrel domain
LKNKFLLILMLCLNSAMLFGQVKIEKTITGYQLMRNGKPYYVKGVGGQVNFDEMVNVGANSFRTWGIDDAKNVLDEAQKRGLTVMLGFWLQHERHGFDYNDANKVKVQLDHFKNMVDQYKDHPALLFWGIGNELDLEYTNPNCWNAVQDIAKYIHQVDPNHPTSTVTAGLDSLEVDHILKRCPDIDMYCVNTYGDIGNVPKSIARYGWKGPYMITEWGPNGHWESPTTAWGVSIEQSSTEKRAVYESRFNDYILPNKDYCLGSYAFLWGAKQEYTETWYGLFSKDNLATEPVDALEQSFTGTKVKFPSPTIKSFEINSSSAKDNIIIKAEEKNIAIINIDLGNSMPGTKAKYKWRIMQESTDKKSGGDKEEEATEIGGLIKKGSSENQISFFTPKAPGQYRLFVSVIHNNKLAYTNIPFKVIAREASDPQVKGIQFKFTDMKSFEQ